MRKSAFIIILALILASCGHSPSGPDTKPVVSAGNDTTIYILDTVSLHGTATVEGDSIILYRWDFTGDGTWDDSATTDTTFIIVVPETTSTTMPVVVPDKINFREGKK